MATRLYLVIPDIHWPKHDPAAVACVLAVARALKPHTAVLLGDCLEVDQFSSHGRKSLSEDCARSWTGDMESFDRDFLRPLRRCTRKRVYIEGNHEYRVERAAIDSPAIRSVLDTISPRVYFGKRDRDLTWVPYQAPVMGHYEITPSLWCVHGWSHAKNAAAAHLARCTSFSIIHGHTHRKQSDSKRDPATGRLLYASSPGFLGILQPIWKGADPTNWSQGFSLVYADPESDSHWKFDCEIDRGETVLPNGKIVRA